MMKQSLETELDTMKKRMSEATTEKSGLESSAASAEEELASTKKTLADDEKYLLELKQSCSLKAEEWEQRQKDAAKVFLQVSSKVKDNSEDKRDRLMSLLQGIAK